MRTKWMLAAIALSAATAAASPSVPFTTVFDSTATFGSDSSSLFFPDQVVIGPGGVVYTNALMNDFTNDIIYSTPSGNTYTSTDIADTNTAVSGVSAQFEGFDNLAVTANSTGNPRLFFAGEDVNNNFGVLQLDLNGNTPTVSDVAFDNDGGKYAFDQTTDIPLEVNSNGQVAFSAKPSATNSAAGPVVAEGTAGSLNQVFTPNGTTSLSSEEDRIGIGSDPTPSVVAQVNTSGATTVNIVNGPNAGPISGSLVPASSGAPMVLGYAATPTLNAALILGQGTGGTGTQQVDLSRIVGNTVTVMPILAGSLPLVADTSVTPGSLGINVFGELSPQGKIALYVPDGSNDSKDTIQYANAVLGLPATVVAAVNTDSSAPAIAKVALSGSSQLPIIGLQESGTQWVPQINDNGYMIFEADVLDTSLPNGDQDQEALLEWNPSLLGSSPTVLLETGQPSDLGGSPSASVVDSFELTDLVQENDFYKNAISDDNYIGVGVNYDDGSSAVLITQVPEPATLALLPITALSLFARRRRK